MTHLLGSWSRIGLFLAIGIGSIVIAGCGSGPVAAPKAYTDYNSPGGTFAIKFPEGWQSDGGGKRGLEWAKFTSGPAMIKVDTGVAGSLMGDIAGSFGGDSEELGPEYEPVHSVHADAAEMAKEEFSGYKELGEIEVMEVALGPARRSEFTSASSFGGGMHGYRGTLLGKDKAVYVYCVCPESDWKTLQPSFHEVLMTFKRGQVE